MASTKLSKVFTKFFESEKAGGLILLGATILSISIASSSWGSQWISIWHHHLDASFGGIKLDLSAEQWINDGLMSIFFLMIGLEIERELYVGELKDIKNALLPIVAAIGGMLFPALLHYMMNKGTIYQQGMGIPMATDIAFALGMLSLVGKRVAPSIKIFLTALAIIDDLGAILVIAFFYSHGLSLVYLGAAIGIAVVLIILNKLRVMSLWAYLLPGIVMWYCMMQSGIHATISGVIVAFCIPFTSGDENSPSYKLQHFLHNPVAFIILPLFAMANTCLPLVSGWYEGLTTSNSLGIIAGLFIGKQFGILLLCWWLIRRGWATLPEGSSWKQLWGASILAGIGFTMSIFIANLAFSKKEIIDNSKFAILVASFISCVIGLLLLRSGKELPLTDN